MLQIGLTGGIGSGKTTIAKIIKTLGYPVYISDQRASDLINHTPEIKQNLKKRFGESIYLPNGELDKKQFATLLFQDKNSIEEVNQIVHPIVVKDFKNWCTEQRTPLLFFESAILFEAKLENLFDYIISISTDMETRIERVMTRDRTSREKVIERINYQMPDAIKSSRSDFVIHNNDGDMVVMQILDIINKLNPCINKPL